MKIGFSPLEARKGTVTINITSIYVVIWKKRVRGGKSSVRPVNKVFNNAGVEGGVVNTTDITSDDTEKVYAVNLMGVHYGLKRVLKVMLKQKSGSIINKLVG